MASVRVLLGVLVLAVLASCDASGSGSNAGETGDRPRPDAVATAAPFGIAVPHGSSGALVGARDGALVECAGWGYADREAGTAAGCDTVFDIGSITKQFTAAAVLKLQQQGRLQVSDRIGEHLAGVPADKRPITVEHLLTHTSGLVDVLGDDYDEVSRADLEAQAFRSELRSEPGSTYHYSNVGYSLLAAIVEEASGLGYEDYLARDLLTPAGMTSTGYVLPGWDAADVAVEYDAAGTALGRPNERPWAPDGPFWHLRGNGGLLSTPRDMFRWHRALEGDAVLDRPAKAALFRPRVREEPGGDTFYGYGWVVQDTSVGRLLWHNGGNGLSYGELARVPERGVMAFWVTNAVRGEDPRWDLERRGSGITEDVVRGLLSPRHQ